MLPADHLFIRPLLGADNTWAAYRVEAIADAGCDATIAQLCSSQHLEHFSSRAPWFIPARPDLPENCLANKRAVFVFPATPDPKEADALRQLEIRLRQNHGHVALAAQASVKLPAAGAWAYVLLGINHARTLPPYTLLGLSSQTTLVATEVVTENDRQWALDNACSFTGAEFMRYRSNNNSKANTTRFKLLELLSLIAQDADTGALDEVFRQESKLSYSLLRLVNSAALAPRSPITSFSQAINLLGRRQLQRWLQLLVFADPNDGHLPNPLLQKAAARGRLLERLSIDNQGDAAFMVGTFSMLDVLLNMPMAEILRQLPLAEPIAKALAEHEGALGALLLAIKKADDGHLEDASEKLAELGIDGLSSLEAQLDALSWASRIHQPFAA